MKRQRGRGGRKPGHQPNRNFESTGPDIKIRGSASHVYEKYLQLARDAQSSGDRVLAESYLQHAEHYFRVLRAMQPQAPPPPSYDQQRYDQAYDTDEGEDGIEDGVEGEIEAGEGHGAGGEQPDVFGGEYGGGDGRYPQQQRPEGQRGEGEFRRNRRRRGRFRPGEGGGEDRGYENRPPREEGQRAEGEAQGEAPREPRPPRGPRPPRPERGERPQREEGPVEGFGDALPAFLGND
jgi:hypothetical protein